MHRTLGIVGLVAFGSLARASRVLTASGCVGAGVLLSAAMPAIADIKGVEPYFVVVTNDGVHMKCSDANIYYPVRILKNGDVLKVDGEGGAWLRASYLPGTRAYVKADEVSFDEASKTAKLTRPSKLMAVDARGNPPWWGLLDSDLPTGTTFPGAEPVKSAAGVVEGYLVPAPEAARGYVRAEATRRATEAEAKAFLPVSSDPAPGSSTPAAAATPASAPTEPAQAPAGVAPTTTASQPTTAPAPTPTPTPTTTAAGTPSAAPASAASGQPAGTTPPAQPPQTFQPAPTPATPPTPARPAPTPAPEAPKVTSPIEDLQTLRTLFNNVMQGGENEAEIQTVISEFNRTMGKLGSTEVDNRLRTALSDRVGALRMRQELIDLKRQAAQNDSIVVEKTRQVRMAIDEAQRQAIYSIVGRMLPSTVYDGRRGLPLMYRIESPDSSITRTLGYVVPREGVDLLTKTGKVVGIVGESKFDPALGVNIVAPRRVDVLEIVGGRLQVITDTSTTTTTTNVGGQSTSTSTKTTTTTTTGSVPDAPGSGNTGSTPDDPNK